MKGRQFTAQEAALLLEIMQLRRDVRGNRFLPDAIPQQALDQVLLAAVQAPSVGYSQPWEFVTVTDRRIRQQIHDSFVIENDKAQAKFMASEGKNKATQYAALKLEGILEAPLNIAVFYRPSEGLILGQTSMEAVGRYSVVCAIQNMWLMARSLNIGMGWVSILNPQAVQGILSAPSDRELVAYLCLGYVDEFYPEPELEHLNWAKRRALSELVHSQRYPEHMGHSSPSTV